MWRTKNWLRQHRLFFCILVLGCLIRFSQFGHIPPGLNQDEATTAYDAWSVLHYGIDQRGIYFPVMFISWGSGMDALPGYLTWPFMLVFGLSEFSVRLPHLALGIASLIVAYALMLRITDKRTALLAAFLLAINPWHIMISRWGLSSNMLPPFFLFAVYAYVTSLKRKNNLFIAMLLLSLCLYMYGTAYLVIPVFGILATILLRKIWKFPWKLIVLSGGIAAITSVPIVLYVSINHFHWNSIRLPFFTIPRLTGTARFHTISSIFSDRWTHAIGENLSTFWNLLLTQNDYIWNSIPGPGLLYGIGFSLSLVGLCGAVADVWAKRGKHPIIFLLAWIISGVVLAAVQPVNTNRINIIFLPLILLMAYGLRLATAKSHAMLMCMVAVFFFFFVSFTHTYFFLYPQQASGAFFEGLGEAIQTASAATDDSVCVTGNVNMPYIFVLFYNRIDPREFLATVNYESPGSEFERVKSFGRYTFGLDQCGEKTYGSYVLHRDERKHFENAGFRLINFTNYSAAIPLRS